MRSERWRELQSVQWDETDLPSCTILAVPWWIFPRGADRDLYARLGEHHSLGIEHLHELIDCAT